MQTLGAPDLAINSAGIQISAPFEALTSADFNQVINVNLIGWRNFAAATLPHLRTGSPSVLVVEERKTLHPVAAALKDFAGTMDVQPACARMPKGIASWVQRNGWH